MCITPDFRQPLQSEYKDKYHALMTLTMSCKPQNQNQIASSNCPPEAQTERQSSKYHAQRRVQAGRGAGRNRWRSSSNVRRAIGGRGWGLHRRERVIVQKRKLKLTFSTKCATPFLIGTSLFTILFPFAKYCPLTFVIVILPYVCPGTKSGKYPTKSKTTCPSMVSFEPNSLSGANTVIRGV